MVFTGDYTVNDQFGSHDVNKVYVYDREPTRSRFLPIQVTHATITSDGDAQVNGNGRLIALVRYDSTGVDHVLVYKPRWNSHLRT